MASTLTPVVALPQSGEGTDTKHEGTGIDSEPLADAMEDTKLPDAAGN